MMNRLRYRIYDKVKGKYVGYNGDIVEKDHNPFDHIYEYSLHRHDKNGDEIFEGDIIKHPERVGKENKLYICDVVKWDSDLLSYNISHLSFILEDYTEVIGNINENHEMVGHYFED